MWLDVLGWVLVVALFAAGMLGAVFPILPGAPLIFIGFLVYGWFFSFELFGVWFWVIQVSILAVLVVADYLVNALGVKKFGGSRASVVGSTIGLLVGPFVIPGIGLLVGPFVGAAAGEMLAGKDVRQACKAGLGALVGFFTGSVVRILLQAIMIVLFIVWIWE